MQGDSSGTTVGTSGHAVRGGGGVWMRRRPRSAAARGMAAIALTVLFATGCMAGWRSAAAPPLPNLGTTPWHLARLNHIDAIPADIAARPWLRFNDKASSVDGSTGCSRISGKYNRNATYLRFSKMVLTTGACPDSAVGRQEQDFRKALQYVDRYYVQGDTLTLSVGADGVAMMVR